MLYEVITAPFKIAGNPFNSFPGPGCRTCENIGEITACFCNFWCHHSACPNALWGQGPVNICKAFILPAGFGMADKVKCFHGLNKYSSPYIFHMIHKVRMVSARPKISIQFGSLVKFKVFVP